MVCIPGWPCLRLPALWIWGLYGTEGTAQAPACSYHLLPPFSTSMLIIFGLQDVLSRFVFYFVMCFAHLKMNISCGGWAVTCCTLLITLCPPVFLVLGAVSVGLWLLHSFLCLLSLFKWREDIFVYPLWTNICIIQETVLFGCTPLAIQIYKSKYSVVTIILIYFLSSICIVIDL